MGDSLIRRVREQRLVHPFSSPNVVSENHRGVLLDHDGFY
jgi:hypothetical protein